MTTHVGGIVLAAGAGIRFGMPKVLASDRRWLRNAVAALHDGGCDDIVVVLGAAVIDVPEHARRVVAADWAEGMRAYLQAGISALEAGPADYAAVLTVDTPEHGCQHGPPGVLDAARVSRSGHRAAPLRAAAGPSRHHRPTALGQTIGTLHGDEGARSFLRFHDDVVLLDCADLATGADIDVDRRP